MLYFCQYSLKNGHNLEIMRKSDNYFRVEGVLNECCNCRLKILLIWLYRIIMYKVVYTYHLRYIYNIDLMIKRKIYHINYKLVLYINKISQFLI